MPDTDIHVSTQANILNYEAVRFWQDMGATRAILARELSIKDVAEIKIRFLTWSWNALSTVHNVCLFPVDVY